MKKSIKLTTLALTALIASSTVTSVFAVEGDPAPAAPQAAQSKGTVKVTADDNNTDPVDPSDPDDKPGTGNHGPLALVYVPSFDFGELKAGSTITASTKNAVEHLETSDTRATGEGWQVTVQYGTRDTTDDTKTVAPAKGDWVSGDSTVGEGFKLELPVVDYDNPMMSENTPKDKVNLGAKPDNDGVTSGEVSDAAMIVAKASAGKKQGMGPWIGNFKAEDSKLTIPANAMKGDYTADLVWTIATAPAA